MSKKSQDMNQDLIDSESILSKTQNIVKQKVQKKSKKQMKKCKKVIKQIINNSINEQNENTSLLQSSTPISQQIQTQYKKQHKDNNKKFKSFLNNKQQQQNCILSTPYFIDKTLFIKSIIQCNAKSILITMPHGTGKSFNMNMLRRFLQLKLDENGKILTKQQRKKKLNYMIFAGGQIKYTNTRKNILKKTKISQTKTNFSYLTQQINMMGYQGSHPVVYLDFKDCQGNSYQQIEKYLINKIIQLYKYHGRYLFKNNKKIQKNSWQQYDYQEYLKLISNKNISINQFNLQYLCKLIHRHLNLTIWILIDNYDSIITTAYMNFGREELLNNKRTYQNSQFRKIVCLFNSIMGRISKNNQTVERCVFIGTILWDAFFSDMTNNFGYYHLMNNYFQQHFGFDKKQVQILINRYYHHQTQLQKQNRIKQITKLFGGYQIGKYTQKYHNSSVIQYLNNNNKSKQNYFTQIKKSQGFNLIKDRIKFKKISQELQKIINNEIKQELSNQYIVNYQHLIYNHYPTQFLKILLNSGYIKKNTTITNQSVKYVLQQELKINQNKQKIKNEKNKQKQKGRKKKSVKPKKQITDNSSQKNEETATNTLQSKLN